MVLLVFHFDMSGNINKDEQLPNIPYILITLVHYHLEISGNNNKDEHL